MNYVCISLELDISVGQNNVNRAFFINKPLVLLLHELQFVSDMECLNTIHIQYSEGDVPLK